ncbi:MAG: YeeE/YedE thiosulfate transporter family protein [SAR324 cluster bacterium]|nr:YeeE/YedE thiosulfate transporter family protein [SAR324 cluster bacterium]
MIDNSMREPETLGEAFKNGYDAIFGKQWPIWVGGILFGMINVFMFAFERPWSSANGIRNWGNWFFNSLEVTDITIISPHLFSTSLLNFGIIGGAFASALLAKQFQVRMAPTRELIKGLLGGTLMGIGSALSFGCNIGGFFSATSALSLAGPAMMIGLIVGSFLGLKLLVWEITYLSPAVLKKSASSSQEVTSSNSQQPFIGFIIILIALGLAFTYDHFDYSTRGGFLVFGLIIGILMQRTRFCFVRAFRDPFMTGESEATRAVAMAVVIGAIGFSILKWTDLKDWDVFVSPGFWTGSLIGGTVFGLGMSLSGGCGTSSLWRAGEGQIKLWFSLVAFALSGSLFRDWLDQSGWLQKIGEPMFLPDFMSWGLALITVVLIMGLWYIIAVWNDVHKKLVVI